MRLTVYTDYALRLLMYLAAAPERRPTIGEVAKAYGISKAHLTKVAHQLGVAGFLATVRGRGGGLTLARPAETIRLGDVVRHAEPDLALVPCFEAGGGGCPILPCCGLKGVLAEARAAFLAVLDRSSIADLTARPAALRATLGLPPLPGAPPRGGAADSGVPSA